MKSVMLLVMLEDDEDGKVFAVEKVQLIDRP
jgi:hypothetical protein